MVYKNIKIGKEYPCFIAAEVGINHNGDINLAKEMIKAAKDAGADAVKFQNYHTEDFILDKKLTYEYISEGTKIVESQFEMFKRYELSFEQIQVLKDYSDELGIIFFSTPTSLKGIEDLEKVGVSLLKNGSDFLVNLELINQMAKTGIPVIISTGMATLGEIDDAVRSFEQAGGKDLIILHCVSAYPTPAEEVNLNKISALAKAFQYPIGFSDHTDGIVAAVGAVVLGACFIEKHFTLNKNLPGPDHHFSSDPKEFKELVNSIRFVEKSMGNSKISPTQKEEFNRNTARLSCVAKHRLKSGHIIQREDIAFSRPANGLPPKLLDILIGTHVKEDMELGEPFLFSKIG
ncbi:N-acetylneuraminate synthase family protein [Leptospira sp. GIMC2001]|uniref:N-acetylneuraminate synthase family protein n=1 Tax=Leptospira sp. GIMC2001 TaxID=1513297 RepID=UPI00234973ED|nr:N-acetylneuraminate synthase family protein [Leptospira sp. GIMC2001]WCL51228.1 N-acetylneuraminate synthase family protein [Leptospira sp. GIMC2001]